jgi:hypothetical protein
MEQLNISQLHGLVRTGLYEVGLKLTGHTVSKTFQEWPPGGIATENCVYLSHTQGGASSITQVVLVLYCSWHPRITNTLVVITSLASLEEKREDFPGVPYSVTLFLIHTKDLSVHVRLHALPIANADVCSK